MSRRYVVGAAAGTALLLSLTGCMSDSGGQATNGGIKLTAAEAVAKTSQKTGRADSFKADLTVNGNSGDGATKIHVTGQFRTRPALAFTARLDQAGHAGRSLPGVGGQAVFVNDMLYVKSQQLSQLMNGKPWLKIDVNRVGQGTGLDVGGLLDQVQKVDPAEQTKMFTASKDVRTVGEQTIDGVKTTHYAGTVSADEALKQFDAPTRAKLQRVYPQNTDQKIKFDLWTDSDQLPRKLVSTWAGTKGENASVTILYRDYGKAVKITAPPAGDVQDFDLAGMLGGRQN
jgi:hypothetical protein